MEGTKTFEELKAWQRAHRFTLDVYKISESFPKREDFCLTNQFRRAAISIAANIAEGYKKKGKLDKLRFFNMSQGSLEECRYYLILSKDLNYITEDEKGRLLELLNDSSRLLNSYCKAISDDIH
ncbi:four helix bundle protein [Alistipes sp. ZOR0009]|jgi:four helix bundle protein|uniref:four helix bundle protein n=1 Tax=Alistipes sp. ZOR0009 TaxID=1339253 RepID=UPI000645774C|nr:four helix bundle protein [Alistipes sp. ZOR0009]